MTHLIVSLAAAVVVPCLASLLRLRGARKRIKPFTKQSCTMKPYTVGTATTAGFDVTLTKPCDAGVAGIIEARVLAWQQAGSRATERLGAVRCCICGVAVRRSSLRPYRGGPDIPQIIKHGADEANAARALVEKMRAAKSFAPKTPSEKTEVTGRRLQDFRYRRER